MLEGKNNWKAWLYLIPSLVLLGIFSFYPIVKSFIIAFLRDYSPTAEVYRNNIANIRANGLSIFTFQNFITVFKNPQFTYAVLNTMIIAFVSVPISIIISLIIAVLITSIKKLKGFFQTLYFLPYVTSAMAVAMAFTVMFANNGNVTTGISMGPVNSVIESVGLKVPLTKMLDKLHWDMEGKETWCNAVFYEKDMKTVKEKELQDAYDAYVAAHGTGLFDDLEYNSPEEYRQSFLNDKSLYNKHRHRFETLGYIDWVGKNASWGSAIFVVLLYSVWAGLAFKILVFTGGITGIDKQYYDAAKIDNTSKWRTFWKITVPMMSPLIVYILITSLIGSFKTYGSIVGLYGTTMGPAARAGLMQTFVGIVYSYMAQGNELIHIGAAASVFLFALIFVITKLTNRFTKKRVHY